MKKVSTWCPGLPYMGHEGIRPTNDKVLAIENALVSQNAQELRSFFWLIRCYHNFLRNLSNILAPLHEPTRQNVKWEWGPRQKKPSSKQKHCFPHPKCMYIITLPYPSVSAAMLLPTELDVCCRIAYQMSLCCRFFTRVFLLQSSFSVRVTPKYL